jgi:hypothetical protein
MYHCSITIGSAAVPFLHIADDLHIPVSSTALLSVTMEMQEMGSLCAVFMLQNIA